jgi:hypothetical protein
MMSPMNLCRLNLDCTSIEETINRIKSQDLTIDQKEQLHQLVCRLETIATHLRNFT